jgi:hypothetical protein
MAHFALQKLHILPGIFMSLPVREQAFIYASTLVRVEDEKAEHNKIKRTGRRKG